jgi:hypothetical protein
VGELLIGVRANDPQVTEQLRELLAPHLVVDSDMPPPNLSLVIGGDGKGGSRSLNLLYRGAIRMLRTSSLGRMLRAVPAHLDGYLPAPEGIVQVEARVLLGSEGAVLVDRRLDESVEQAEGRFVRMGYRLLDVPVAELDESTTELVLREPRIGLEPAARDALDRVYPLDRREVPPGRTGRVPIERVIVIGPHHLDRSLWDRPSPCLTNLARYFGDRRRFGAADLDLLGRLIDRGFLDQHFEVSANELIAILAS